MTEIEQQIAVIRSLVGDLPIQIEENGFLSRGYVIDGGRLVFKFPRSDNVRYDTEAENLRFLQSLDLGVHLQKVAFVGPGNAYLGIYGVPGQPLERLSLSPEQKASVGRQLGNALKKLHAAEKKSADVMTLQEEIDAWTDRVKSDEVRRFLRDRFTADERQIIDGYFFENMPQKLYGLGENLVFSHGDLGEGNLFMDADGTAGIIDFNESCYLEEAADFMDLADSELCEKILLQYGADTVLRQKVAVRRLIRPLIVLQPYLHRGNRAELDRLTALIRNDLLTK